MVYFYLHLPYKKIKKLNAGKYTIYWMVWVMFLLMPKSCTEQLHRTPNGQLPASLSVSYALLSSHQQVSRPHKEFILRILSIHPAGCKGPIEEQTGHLRLHTKVLCTIDNFLHYTATSRSSQPLVLHNKEATWCTIRKLPHWIFLEIHHTNVHWIYQMSIELGFLLFRDVRSSFTTKVLETKVAMKIQIHM